MRPVQYMKELTPAGYLNPLRNDKTFLQTEDTFSPVIQFRWGYKASEEELQLYGDGLYLNEENYWGGGPFANGCSSLPDLWGKGLDDSLFLWLHIQHLNPTNDRNVYTCPLRPYYVLAALRLARLVEAIRKKQADTPITIVCHSQGNMIGMAAAFLGDRLAPVADPTGTTGRCVADSYVLCNAPYSLVQVNKLQGWTELGMKDKEGRQGRQSAEARYKTLAAFFDIIRKQGQTQQSAESVDIFSKNEAHGFDVASDRQRYGCGPTKSTVGRVTLYFNPHDQVISASPVQGIGWRGMSEQEIKLTQGEGVFTQRVFSQGFMVGEEVPAGKPKYYDFWTDHYNKPKRGSKDFWYPHSQPAEYSVSKGLDTNRSYVGKVLTVVTAPFVILFLKLKTTPINELPPDDWKTPLHAPALPEPFAPKAKRFGKTSDRFDQGSDAPGESRNVNAVRAPGDPYEGDRKVPKDGTEEAKAKGSDAAEGNEDSEASLRYEDHALLRLKAKRQGLYKNDVNVKEEDDLSTASEKYKAWRTKEIKLSLARNINTHATDHSTIMTNGMHAQKALAYDVAFGACHIRSEDLNELRKLADWRYVGGLGEEDPNQKFEEYFLYGLFQENSPLDWTKLAGSDGAMPEKIVDKRGFFAGEYGEQK